MDVYKMLYEQSKKRNQECIAEVGRLTTELQLAIWERDLYQLKFEEVFRFLNEHSPNALAAFYLKHPKRMDGMIKALDAVIEKTKQLEVA